MDSVSVARTRPGVALVTLRRPAVRNAIDQSTQEQLEALWDELDDDPTVRVAVITGDGDQAFCSGVDMKSGLAGLEYWNAERRGGFAGLSTRRLRVPVVARVNGLALGGGFELMLNCDVAVASTSAWFGLPEARVGRIPLEGGVRHLLRQLPDKLARWHMLTGELISAESALRWGLVNRVVPAEELDAAVDEVIDALLAAAPLSHEAILELATVITEAGVGHVERLGLPAILRALGSEDAEEGMKAFREKRPARWSGR